MAYHIGTVGVPWGAAEKERWLSERKIHRSYAEQVLNKLEPLKQRFDVEQYGALSIDKERYPLMCVRSKAWSADKPTVLVTGASGFVGSHVVRCLLERQNFTVFVLCRRGTALDIRHAGG